MSRYIKYALGLISVIVFVLLMYNIREEHIQNNISYFKQGRDLYYKDMRINKKRGWKLRNRNTVLLKGDLIVKVSYCSTSFE